MRGIGREGFRFVHVLHTPAEVDAAEIEMQLLWNNRKSETGPFDIIGDVHGCATKLRVLLEQQPGWRVAGEAADAQSLLDMARRGCPDLVLADWELPGMPAPAAAPPL